MAGRHNHPPRLSYGERMMMHCATALAASLCAVLIVSGPAYGQPDGADQALRLVPIDTIGSVAGNDAITTPHALRIAADGSAYVLFGQEFTVRHYSPHGDVLGTYGRYGQGPGEMSSPGNIALDADRLWVFEQSGRVTWFSLGSGYFETSIPWDEPFLGATRFVPVARVAGRGTLYSPQISSSQDPTTPLDYPVLLLRDTAAMPDTLAVLRYHRAKSVYLDPARPSGRVGVTHPFPLSDLWQPHPGIPGIVVADPSELRETGEVVVEILLTSGSVFQRRAHAVAADPMVDSSERELIAEQHSEWLLNANGVVPPSREAAREWVRAEMNKSQFRPAVRSLRVASDGLIWLEASRVYGESGPSEWLVLDAVLRRFEWVVVPAGMTILDSRGETAWARMHDSLNVPYLVRLETPWG